MYWYLAILACVSLVSGTAIPIPVDDTPTHYAATTYDVTTDYHRDKDTVMSISILVAADAITVDEQWLRTMLDVASSYFIQDVPLHIRPAYFEWDVFETMLTPTQSSVELLKQTRTIRRTTAHGQYAATITVTTRHMDLQGVAYHDIDGKTALFCSNDNTYSDLAAAVVGINPDLMFFTASVVAHELGHLWGLAHYDVGGVPYIMNAITVGGNRFSPPSLNLLSKNLDIETATGCLAELPNLTLTRPLSYNDKLFPRDPLTLGIFTSKPTAGFSFNKGFSCTSKGDTLPIRVISRHYAECDVPSVIAGETFEVSCWLEDINIITHVDTVEKEPFFESWQWNDALCQEILLKGDGFIGHEVVIAGMYNESYYVFPKIMSSATELVMKAPPVHINAVVFLYAYFPDPQFWKDTGLDYDQTTCTPIAPFRCTPSFSCADNGLLDHCCSVAGWCGQTADHCLAGNCINGPCCPKGTSCSGPWIPLEPFRCNESTTCADNGLPGYCCSSAGWCGLTVAHCGDGCQNGPCIA